MVPVTPSPEEVTAEDVQVPSETPDIGADAETVCEDAVPGEVIAEEEKIIEATMSAMDDSLDLEHLDVSSLSIDDEADEPEAEETGEEIPVTEEGTSTEVPEPDIPVTDVPDVPVLLESDFDPNDTTAEDETAASEEGTQEAAEIASDTPFQGDAVYSQSRPVRDHTGRTASFQVVSIVAYLIGVPRMYFGRDYLQTTYDDLSKKEEAKVIRTLCIIRNGLMRNIGRLTTELRQNLVNIDSMPEYFDPQLFTYLTSRKIRVITGNRKNPKEYLITVNAHISNLLNQCKNIFPMWVSWDYIRDMIVMPRGTKEGEVSSATYLFNNNRNVYPYQCYINWPINRPDAFHIDPEHYAMGTVSSGNVLNNDRRFLTLLYRVHQDTFEEFDRVADASMEDKQRLSSFMQRAEKIVLLVDCENSDPYRLCGMLRHMRENAYRTMNAQVEAEAGSVSLTNFSKIQKIILFDDVHTVDTWDILERFTGIPVQHEEVERVLGNKSLVDIAMTVGACKEHYVSGVDSFLLASSDSDYWGLIRSLPDARFMVLAEHEKFSMSVEELYRNRGIAYVFMNDFSSNVSDIKTVALQTSMETYMNNRILFNFNDMLDDLYQSLRMTTTTREREAFREETLKRLRCVVSPDGTFQIRVCDD
ncbi:MAG: hypothetical protein IJ083_17055 [Clostridia bacterium]|nr:hypothetical protein [Clostridia bacterium]